MTPRKPKRRRARPAAVISGDVPAAPEAQQTYVFRLFVSGHTDKSTRAIANIKKICEAHFPGQYQLDVVDVYQQPQLASGEQIFAVPALVKKAPGKLKKILGDLGDTQRFIQSLK